MSDFRAKTASSERAVTAQLSVDRYPIYDHRERHGLTQKALAVRVGTTQSVIARLENADYEGHSLRMMARIAAAVGERFTVAFSGDTEVDDIERHYADSITSLPAPPA